MSTDNIRFEFLTASQRSHDFHDNVKSMKISHFVDTLVWLEKNVLMPHLIVHNARNNVFLDCDCLFEMSSNKYIFFINIALCFIFKKKF